MILVGEEEIHLVAMLSKQKKYPRFWCYSVPKGLYNASLGMLNLRCLSIVFDLDETLIVANTMKSFEDRIELLRGWIVREIDPIRSAGMQAEVKRYMDDRVILKQYVESDSVMDNGRVFKVQMEEVPPLSDNHERIFRPIIRLPGKNIVLTRINPEVGRSLLLLFVLLCDIIYALHLCACMFSGLTLDLSFLPFRLMNCILDLERWCWDLDLREIDKYTPKNGLNWILGRKFTLRAIPHPKKRKFVY